MTAKSKSTKPAEPETKMMTKSKSTKRAQPETKMTTKSKSTKRAQPEPHPYFVVSPIPHEEALKKWPDRYKSSKNTAKTGYQVEDNRMQAKHHYDQANMDGFALSIGDDVYVRPAPRDLNYIAKVTELFEGVDNEPYFRCQWYYRAEDTVIGLIAELEKDKVLDDSQKNRVYLSDVEDDNHMDCIIEKLKILQLPTKVYSYKEKREVPSCDFYYDMNYQIEHLTFSSIKNENAKTESDASSAVSSDSDSVVVDEPPKNEKFLLDLYSGCGAMSTGLCMGASLSNVKLITKWAVDFNKYACESLKHNHPETYVRNESAGDFLTLLKEWNKLCQKFSLIPRTDPIESYEDTEEEADVEEEDEEDEEVDDSEVFEVQEFLDICYGDPKKLKTSALYLKVRWKGYGPEEDTWEPVSELGNCNEKMKEFVTQGFKSHLLPLPGSAYFICGGPPCQGVSGFNRYRDNLKPLTDEKNRQLAVYMDIINYLKPSYLLMENVVDLVKFAEGFLARYAVARLVSMNYQTRLGMMAAGSYGVPQVRNRVFLWGAMPSEMLPAYPLPTHEVLSRLTIPKEFQEVQVGFNYKHLLKLEKALQLSDAIQDLPATTNFETNESRNYDTVPVTTFQKFIRLQRAETIVALDGEVTLPEPQLYDHRPYKLQNDDLKRVCLIPKQKGANFRNLDGVKVKENTVYLDPAVERPMLPSGKPLVPNYAISFTGGKSKKPFGRLWWDEAVGTVVTRPEPHNQAIIHPEQDRVLSPRENARSQGFPDFYKLCGPVKEKYIQVGNAVAVPVGVALGYSFGLASRSLSNDKAVVSLPFKYPNCLLPKPNVEE